MNSESAPFLRIGIIGSGIGGASAAYFAYNEIGEDIEIVVFEKASRLGGRLLCLDIADVPIEAGGNLIHSSNRYLNEFIEDLNLERIPPNNLVHPSIKRTSGIWNGQSFDFRSSASEFMSLFKMMRRYGQGPVQIRPLIASAIGRWTDIYDRQEEEEAFDTPEAMLEGLNLIELFETSSYDYFQQQGIDRRYLDEFATGLARFDFGQDAHIHALGDAMSLIGTGIRGQNYVVKGGNELLCQGLLGAAEAEVRLETGVVRIARQPAGDGTADQYSLTTSAGDTEVFDAVIIATPLESAELTFEQIDLPEAAAVRRPYQTIFATFVSGTLRSSYFGVSKKDMPNFVMTKEDETIPFLSISDVGQVNDSPAKIYKIFSRSKPAESLLDDLFNDYDEDSLKQVSWQACPILKPGADLPPFALAEGLYYINAIESLAPTMEAITIASRNAINLLDEELLEPVDDEE